MQIHPTLFRKAFPVILLGAAALLLSLTTVTAQQTPKQDKKAEKTAKIKSLVDSQRLVFVAQTAMPMTGRVRQLTSDYDLTVTPGLLESYLPYFGRAYTAPIDPSSSPLRFTSKDFDYQVADRKKGGWDVTIKPKDYKEVQTMYLSISQDGYASLQVTNTNRQAISFNGYITAPKPKKHK